MLSKCEYCGNAFNSFGNKVCAECSKEIDDAYIKVRKYIYQNSGKANFASIINNTDISEKTLKYLIKLGRINIEGRPTESNTRCKLCGAEVSSGFLCDHCKIKVLEENLKPQIAIINKKKKEQLLGKDKDWILPLDQDKS